MTTLFSQINVCLYLLLVTYLLNMVSTTQTLSQIKSQEFIGSYVINGIQDLVKCCIKGWVHLDLRPDNMLFGGLQPIVIDIFIER